MTLDREALAAIVGDVPALMLFGQGGAAIGKTFNLRRVDGRPGRVMVEMTAAGAIVRQGDK